MAGPRDHPTLAAAFQWDRLKRFWSLLMRAGIKFGEDGVFVRAAALAYYTIFALPPMLLIIVWATSMIYDRATVQYTIYGMIADTAGPESARQINETVSSMTIFQGQWWTSMVGVVGLIITSTTVFVAMQGALDFIFRVKPKPERGLLKLLRDRVLSFTLLLSMAFILIVTLTINAFIASFGGYLTEYLPPLTWLILAMTSYIVPFFVVMLLFALIFRFLPDVKLPWRNIWRGATFTTILFFLGMYAIQFYVSTFNPGNLYDTASSIMVIMLWIFYASAIFLFGAVFTYVYTLDREGYIPPTSYAVPFETREVEAPHPEDEGGEAEDTAPA